MLKFNANYFGLTLLVFIIEALIAMFVHDRFIRPYFGDVLVAVLIYCFVKSFFDITVWKAAIGVLIFSFCVEFLQFLDLIGILGLTHSKLARATLGISFSWLDILCYISGIGAVVLVEYGLKKRNNEKVHQ